MCRKLVPSGAHARPLAIFPQFHRTRPNDTLGCRRRVTCPIGDSLSNRLSIEVTGYRHGSGSFYLPAAEAE
ncbi:hypothetical protein EVAR_5780_1 [Eumeta japonica]|uniref:Uncharacterized protein n=1 Tax=Eumeta variegata TaxID=151549 RepID=A0A4C1T7T9_EUMVA|nr:hypothetical protein EVAR_5780_1 [Eumeta japonica]